MSAQLEALFAEALPRVQSTHTPTMGNLKKIRYTHDSMIDLIIAEPWISQNHLAAHFGYSPAWISNIFASDAFQARLAERRKEVIDPTLIATIEERVKGLTLQAFDVLQQKLSNNPSDNVALRAAELGVKAMGLGGHAPPKIEPIDLSALAERLVALNPHREREIEGEVVGKEISSD